MLEPELGDGSQKLVSEDGERVGGDRGQGGDG